MSFKPNFENPRSKPTIGKLFALQKPSTLGSIAQDDFLTTRFRSGSRGELSGECGVSHARLILQDAKTRFANQIRQDDIDHWHKHGFVIIEKFLSPAELERIHKGVYKHMPTWNEYKQKEIAYRSLSGASGRVGSGSPVVRYDFPYADDALNELAVHPFLLAFAERLAGTDDLALSLGHLVGKYAGKGDYEQELHCDYSNNTLVIPQKSNKWIDIPMIIYLTDVTVDLGPTFVVSQTHTEHRKLVEDGKRFHSKKHYPDLYDVELPVIVPAGSVVVYSMRTFHRGSGMKATEGSRIVQFTGYHTANIPWMGPMDQQHRMGTPEMDQFLLHVDPRQRQVVGFPPVGHAYWNDTDVLEGVRNRYPTMDMRPYGGSPANVAS